MRSTVRRLSAAVLGGAASAGLVLGLAAGSHAATILSGVNLTVASDDSVTVTSHGDSVFFGNVGSAGSYGFINGWGVSSGTVTWRDTNNNVAATLSSSGVSVPASNRIANSNGSMSGSSRSRARRRWAQRSAPASGPASTPTRRRSPRAASRSSSRAPRRSPRSR